MKNKMLLRTFLATILLFPWLPTMAQEQSATEPEVPIGQHYLVETYRDWQRICIKTNEGQDPCHIYQLIKNADGLPIGEITLLKVSEPEGVSAAATILTPLGTLLTSRLVLSLDDGTKADYPYSWCDKRGCNVRVAFTDDEVLSMKKGRAGSITIETISAPGELLKLPISFLGFTAAIGDLR
ncbi:MAG: invasion associated locus B family protein [bacterium]